MKTVNQAHAPRHPSTQSQARPSKSPAGRAAVAIRPSIGLAGMVPHTHWASAAHAAMAVAGIILYLGVMSRLSDGHPVAFLVFLVAGAIMAVIGVVGLTPHSFGMPLAAPMIFVGGVLCWVMLAATMSASVRISPDEAAFLTIIFLVGIQLVETGWNWF